MTTRTATSLCHWGAFTATIENGRLTKTVPWPGSGADPDMIGAWPDLVYSPKRIDRPHIRRGWLKHRSLSDGSARGSDEMVPVDWDIALDLVAEELARVRDEHGYPAIFGGSYGWSSAGRLHHARTQTRRLLGAFGGFTDQITNYSWGAAQIILPHILGNFDAVSHAATSWDSIIGNTDLLVAFGGLNAKNWHVTSGGAGFHHMPDHIATAAASGTEFILVSPMADDRPPSLDAQWIAPRPGTDTALILALCHELYLGGRADQDFLKRYCHGADRFRAYIEGADGTPKTAAWAAEICGIDEGAIRGLAERISTGRIMLTASWSLQRAEHGEQSYWAVIALAALLGQIGLEGGGFTFGYGSMNAVGESARRGYVPQMPKLPNPANSAIPVARVADMLENPGATIEFNGERFTFPDTKLVYWAGGNPFHHTQDLFRFQRAWAKPETIIVHEPWWTATAKRADIVLPATTSVERNDIGGSSRDRHIFYMPKLIEPVGLSRNDRDIFGDIAERLGCQERYNEGRSEEDWLRLLWRQTKTQAEADQIDVPDFDTFRAVGVINIPSPATPEVYLSAFRSDPDKYGLATPSGAIELWSETLAGLNDADIAPGPIWMPPNEWLGNAAPNQLALLTRQPAKFLHGQLAQVKGLEPPGPAAILIHPDDAAQRSIADGIIVIVSSPRGACLATASISEACRKGVVAMETGRWFDPDDQGSLDRAGNPNAVTADIPTSQLTQACAAQSCLVEVSIYDPEAPSA